MSDSLFITSTHVAAWKARCEAFSIVGCPWELRDVTTVDHEKFLRTLSDRYNRKFVRNGMTAYFEGSRPTL